MTAPSVVERDEQVLVARLVAGDDAALAEVYDRHGPLVFGIARRVCVDETAAEDVCQEVFVHLWAHADVIDLDRSSLRGWLSVLAHRRAVDMVRRTERLRRREERSACLPDPSRTVLDLAEISVTEETARLARTALATLPEQQRAVLELAFWEGLSYREVARRLGIPEGTAKSRVRLALARLAILLEEVVAG